MITVSNEVKIYEIDGKDVPIVGGDKKLLITSHWNERKKVNIQINGKKITVIADDLRIAIDNATNTNRY